MATGVLAGIGSVVGPFSGGNEAEWTRYLERLIKSERDRFMAILNSMDEGVAIIGLDRRIRFMNPSLVKDFGDGVNRLCYQHFRDRNEPCRDVCKLPEVIKGSTERWEYNYPNGTTYDVIASPFSDADQTPCLLSTYRNITQRKQIELELMELNQLKSELLSQKTKELESTTREVDRLEEEKRRFVRFLSVVAHDLRAPLSATQSCLWVMLDGYAGDVNDEQRDLLQRSTHRLDELMALINDLLDIPRIESGQLVNEMSEISLAEVIERSIEGLDNMAIEKGIDLKLELPQRLPLVYGSGRRLQQVVTNLISNAIKYSPDGAVIIRVSQDSNAIRTEVIDSGIGVLPDEMPRLFQDFFRGSNAEVKGTGLGLSISRRIVEAHGGRIWAESPCQETGKGSKFAFTLPKRKTSAASKNRIKGR